MPELPEIETVKLQLAKVLIGQRLVQSNFAEINNSVVTGIDRKGKMLLINFGPPSHKASEGLSLGFHFKMTGQLIYDPTSPKASLGAGRIVGGHPSEDFVAKLPNSHTREIFEFEKGKLFFNDMRKFGWVKINPTFAEKLGPEPFNISADDFVKIVQKSKKPIKQLIMDQDKISGVGNIYANDALWEAGIRPQALASQISVDDLKNLFAKIKLVLNEGIKYGGATAANYVDLHGLGGHYQDHFRVYNREGKPCLKCKTPIKKIILGGRGTYFCPVCQPYNSSSSMAV